MTDAVVLVSAGRHPVSGRARRSEVDARALEMALTLADSVTVLHAGDPEEPALREYLGMGIGSVEVIRCPENVDVLRPLADRLRGLNPVLILGGERAERGFGSGALPHALAVALDRPVLPRAVAIEPGDGESVVTVAERGGRRRRLAVAGPLVVTVNAAAPPARPFAWAAARRGRIEVSEPSVAPAPLPAHEVRPARRRPPRLQRLRGASAAERLAAAQGRGAAGGGQQFEGEPAEQAGLLLRRLAEWGAMERAVGPSAAEEEQG